LGDLEARVNHTEHAAPEAERALDERVKEVVWDRSGAEPGDDLALRDTPVITNDREEVASVGPLRHTNEHARQRSFVLARAHEPASSTSERQSWSASHEPERSRMIGSR